MRRRQRKLRPWWRHEQQSIAAVLATVSHHSYPKVDTANDGLRAQKTVTSSGAREARRTTGTEDSTSGGAVRHPRGAWAAVERLHRAALRGGDPTDPRPARTGWGVGSGSRRLLSPLPPDEAGGGGEGGFVEEKEKEEEKEASSRRRPARVSAVQVRARQSVGHSSVARRRVLSVLVGFVLCFWWFRLHLLCRDFLQVFQLFPLCLCSGDSFSDVLARCGSGGPRSLVAPRWCSENISHCFQGSTWRTARDERWFSSHRLFRFLRALPCGLDFVQFPHCLYGRPCKQRRWFLRCLAAYGSPEFWGSEVQGPEPTHCSAWRWQLIDKVFLS